MNEVIHWIAANLGRCDPGGWHCTPQAHRAIRTFPLGTVRRASVGLFNTPEEGQALAQAIPKITRMQDPFDHESVGDRIVVR